MNSTVYFSGPCHPLSNLYPFTFVWKGLKFLSLESAYHWEKAIHHGLLKEAEHIRTCPDPTFGVMYLGKKLPTSASWEECKLSCMFALLKLKYQYSLGYRLDLQSGTDFIEDTAHPFWGRGHHGNGLNWLGHLHQDIKHRGSQYSSGHGTNHEKVSPWTWCLPCAGPLHCRSND